MTDPTENPQQAGNLPSQPKKRRQGGKGKPFTGADDPRNGSGAKGVGGRPSNKFLARMEAIADQGVPEGIIAHVAWLFQLPGMAQYLIREHPAAYISFLELARRCWRDAADRRHGKATLPISLDVDAAQRAELHEMTDAELVEEYLASLKRSP